MRIGFVSAWYERGAAYVTRAYLNLLRDNHDVFVYARGGGSKETNSQEWNQDFVTYGYELPGTEINFKHFRNWVIKSKIDTLFFNEQREFDILYLIKINLLDVKIGTYIDYYTESTIKQFDVYDFIICNTKRHYSAFKWHKQCYYVPWGTDTDFFTPYEREESNQVRFFHSMGVTTRKGTSSIINAFIDNHLGKKSKLIIHTQIPISVVTNYSVEELKAFNIEIIEKTVAAPGLYYMGDVYVYPTKLDGLGLTVFEALSSGMPVIATDYAPMNEIIDDTIGKLVDVDRIYCRADGYYWPMTTVKEQHLAECMTYYIEHSASLNSIQNKCREIAIDKFSWNNQKEFVNRCFQESIIKKCEKCTYEKALSEIKKKKSSEIKKTMLSILPDWMRSKVYCKLNRSILFKRQ